MVFDIYTWKLKRLIFPNFTFTHAQFILFANTDELNAKFKSCRL